MATFNVSIGKEDIQEGVLLPEDWYEMQIVKEPFKDKNSYWKGAGEKLSFKDAVEINEKSGENIVVRLKVESSTPEFQGRAFTKWLPLPNPTDADLFMNDGQPKADWKAEVIHTWVEAFGGVSEGKEVSLSENQKAFIYVIQEVDNRAESAGETINSISMNIDPKSIGGGSGSPLGDGTERGLEPSLDGGGAAGLGF